MLPFTIAPRDDDAPYVDIVAFSELKTLSEMRSAWKSYLTFMAVLEESGYEGWCGGVAKENMRLRKFLKRIGCIEYAKDEKRVFVRRLAKKPYGRIDLGLKTEISVA